MLGNIVGDHFAVNSSILVTFLLGIGLGTKFAYRLRGYLWAVEIGIGIYAILFTYFIPYFDIILFEKLSVSSLFANVLLSCSLLMIPAILVGVSLPLFSAYLQQLAHGRAFSRSYMIYNFGAALTALLIEFFLIRQLGIRQAMISIASLNIVIGSALFFRRIQLNIVLKPKITIQYSLHITLPLIIVSIASAIFQLTMIKFAEFIFGPYHETFAMVLGIVLLGIGLGTLFNHFFQIRFQSFLILNMIYLALMITLFPNILLLFSTVWGYLNSFELIIWKLLILFLIMGPSAISFGAAIPSLMKDESNIAKESGHLLFISSMANTFGYLLMVFFIHAWLEYGFILILVIGLLIIALSIHSWPKFRTTVLATILGFSTFILVIFSWNEDLLYMDYTTFTSPKILQEELLTYQSSERFRKYDEAFSINQVGPNKLFFINGYTSVPLNAPSEYLVGFISSLVSPRLDKGLILGLGSGATAGTVAELFNQVDVVEISPTIIEKQSLMKKYSFNIVSKPNVNIVCDDGLRFMKTTQEKYDLILNTVTSPLYFSSSKLYTRDFFKQVKKHLRTDGIYTTWLDRRVGEQGLKIILTTLNKEFKYCWVTQMKSHYYLLIASNSPMNLYHESEIYSNTDLKDYFAYQHGYDIENLRYSIVNTHPYDYLSSDEIVPVNTADLPVLEYEIAQLTDQSIQRFALYIRNEYSITQMNREVFKKNPIDLLHLTAFYMKVDNKSDMSQYFTQLAKNAFPKLELDLKDYILSFYTSTVIKYQTPESLDKLAFWYWQYHLLPEVEKVCKELIRLDPNYYNVYYRLGLVRYALKDFSGAIQYFDKELERDPNHCDALFWKGKSYLKMGDPTTARRSLLECVWKKPWYNNVRLYLASTYEAQDPDSMKYYLEQELILDPVDKVALQVLGR